MSEENEKHDRPDLVEVFLAEHRALMRGLAAILQRVESGDLVAARELADELDRDAAPHIRFEEEILYPEVGRARGSQIERRLREEHVIIQQAIRRLISSDLTAEDLSVLREELKAAFKVAVEHAESCGTLISHLESLSPAQRKEAVRRHGEFRKQGVRWSELSAHAS